MNRLSSTRGISLPFVLMFITVFILMLSTASHLLYNEVKAFEVKQQAYRMNLMKDGTISYILSLVETNNYNNIYQTLEFEKGYAFIYSGYRYNHRCTFYVSIYLYEGMEYAMFDLVYDFKTETYSIE